MTPNNKILKEKAKVRGVHLWEVARQLGISDTTLTRHLRLEVPADEYQRIDAAIDELAKSKGA